MGNKPTKVKERVERSQKTGTLTLSNGLSKIPARVWQVSMHLHTLNLSENKLTRLPPQLLQCSKLKHLNVSSNSLHEIPREIGQLKTLCVLKVDKNRLTLLPVEVFSLPKLHTLTASHNELKTMEIHDDDNDQMGGGDGGGGGGVSSLQVLDISHNQLVMIPATINSLTRLKEVDISGNPLLTLPAEMGGMVALRVVRLRGTRVDTLPMSLLLNGTVHLIDFEGTPLFDGNQYYKLEGYDEYTKRRKRGADKQIHGGVAATLS